jgi:SAM-dependent methyltransferase
MMIIYYDNIRFNTILSTDYFVLFCYSRIMSNFLRLDKEKVPALRDFFVKAGLIEQAILERLGVPDFPTLKGTDVLQLCKRTGSGSPLDTLIRLFLIDVPCETDAVRKTFESLKIEELIEAGILGKSGNDMVEAGIKILPHRGLYIAFDRPGLLLTGLKENYVMGIGSSTLTLSNVTIRKHSLNTLDLGCGCGYHALLAASHSGIVYASDINERALDFTRFNAALNGFDNIECVCGSLFEPFAGKKFDLIISNPPFVISPERRYIYRDGGLAGNEICRRIAEEAPAFLTNGGYLQMLCNWAEYEGKDFREGLAGWFTNSNCDAWVIRSESRNIETYASTWIKHTEKEDSLNFPDRFENWIGYYQKLGISSVGAGIINMRKSLKEKNWFRADKAPEKMIGPCGRYIELGFDAFDFLFTADDKTMLKTKFRLSEDARLERVCAPTPEGWEDESINLTLNKGLRYSGGIDPVLSNMIISCDGSRTLTELLAEVSSAVNVPVSSLQQGFCNLIREMVSKGFLFRAG